MNCYRLGWLVTVLAAVHACAVEVCWRRSDVTLPARAAPDLARGFAIGDFNRDGAPDLVCSFSGAAPALTLSLMGTTRATIVIESAAVGISGGGATLDIDGDGDLDVVFGTEGAAVWWWENPYPNFNGPWVRHAISGSGGASGSAPLFADLTASGRPQLVFWNQQSNTVYWAAIPGDVRSRTGWEMQSLFSPQEDRPVMPTRLLAVDIDMDSTLDLVAGNYWLKRMERGFKPTRIGNEAGQVAVGRFREGTYPQFVIAPANGKALMWYECKAYPDRAISWAGRPVLGFETGPVASLAVADVDGSGGDDIFVSEKVKDAGGTARAWIVYSDRRGNFRPVAFDAGTELRDAQFVDMNKDGRPDLVGLSNKAGSAGVELWLNVDCGERK